MRHRTSKQESSAVLIALVTAIVVLGALPLAESAPAAGEKTRFVVGLQAIEPSHRPGEDFHGGKILRVDHSIRFVLVETATPDAFAKAVRGRPDVRYVEEDRVVQFLADEPAARRTAEPDGGVSILFNPNDPKYSSQHGPQQVRANLAWDTTLGDSDAAVCIIDTGVRYTHEDLTGTRWLGGYDYINNDNNPMDDNGHGTHVAGSAAAGLNNGKGIAGMANVGIYGVKALDAGGSGSWSAVASAVTWCADNTIARTVISLSLGGGGGAQVLQDAVTYAYNTKSKLLIAAAGNGGCTNCVLYPGAYPEVVAVTSLQKDDSICGASSQGPEAEMSGPGHDIESTWYTSDTAYFVETGCWTSMATPHVSGAAALVWSHLTSLTNTQLRQRLRDTAKDLGTPGHDSTFGYGKVDAKCLLDGTPCSGGSGTTLYSENFDSGSASGWTLGGLWHVSNCRSSSPSYSLAYNKVGCPTNFNTGATTVGDAVSPSINIPSGATNVVLSWKSWHSTESGTTYDQKTVSVSTNGGSTWTQLWQEDGSQSVWNDRSLDLTAYAGSTIKIRYRFDSVDSIANDGEGWYVDDVKVTAVVSGSLPYNEKFDGGSAPGWTIGGLWHVSNCRSFSPSYSLAYNKVGCPTNFNTGAANSGSAISPAITIPAGTNPVHLSWQSWHSTESGTTYDRKTVAITTNDGVSWTQLWQEDGSQSVWNARSIDISAYAGNTVKIRFHFDSVDSIANDGEGWYVDDVKVEKPAATVPGAPQNLQATAGPNPGQIRLTWQAPTSDGGSAITSYKVYRATSSGGPYSHIATVSGTTLTYTDGSLGNGVTRYYRVSAVNGVGEGPQSNTAGATTWTTPGAPTSLSATAGANAGEIRLTWNAPTNTGGTSIQYYKVYRATSSGGPYTWIASPTSTSYTDTGRTLATQYWYYVSAVNAVGEGPGSNTDCATAGPLPSLC